MRGSILFIAAAIFGGLAYWSFDTWSSRQAERVVAEDFASRPLEGPGEPAPGPHAGFTGSPEAPPAEAAAPAPAPPALAARPAFVDAAPAPAPSPSSAAVISPPTAPPDPAIAQAAAFEEERSLARALYETGDRERGMRKLSEIYALSKDRPGVDLGPEVSRLLESETSFERRREYARYLAAHDRGGRHFDDQLARAARAVQGAEGDENSAYRAWDDLTLAYDMAQDRSLKRKVLGTLDPFITRMVFSGRYTPILKSHMIQAGESLMGIASRFHTTADALRRLNALKSDTIQPRQRLRILPGKVKVFVDKSDFLLWVRVDDRLFLEFPVGLGRDNATPTGSFVIKVRQKDPTWWRPGEPPIPPGDARNVLGSRWLGFQETKDFAGFGIHGTEDPASVGKESSAGCVRMRNQDIEVLFDFVPQGTEVLVQG